MPRSRTSSEEIYADEEPIESEVCVEQPLAENMEDVPPEGDLFLGATDRSNESLEPPAIAAVSPVSLGQLTSLIALEKDYIFRANNLRERLKNLRLSCGLNRRLLHISASAYRSMVAHFKTADQMRFLEFYDAGQGITETTSFGANTFGASHTDANDTGTGLASGSPNWMEMLPPVHQENILRFLNRIRSETDYVAECLSRLSSTKLVAFTSHYQSGNILDSVLPGRSNMKGQRLGKDPGVTPRDLWPRELGQDDPIFILLHGVFDDSLGPGSWEYHQRIEVWATACARVMVGGRRGSDEIVTTTLDAFASLQEWTMKPRLESYLTQVLRKGAFLLESPTNQAMNFEESVETRNAKAAVSASNFFESSVQGLFTLLADNLPQTIPLDLRNLMRSMLGKIENSKIRIRAEIFLVSKWFFGTFISNLLVYPEVSCTSYSYSSRLYDNIVAEPWHVDDTSRWRYCEKGHSERTSSSNAETSVRCLFTMVSLCALESGGRLKKVVLGNIRWFHRKARPLSKRSSRCSSHHSQKFLDSKASLRFEQARSRSLLHSFY